MTHRLDHLRYLTSRVWKGFAYDVAILLTAVALLAVLTWIGYTIVRGQAVDDAVVNLIIPSDYQLPTI